VSPTTFIDTQFVIALVNERDQFHQQAVKVAREYIGQPLLTTDAVLLEIGNALARNFRSEAVAIIERFLTSDNVTIVRLSPQLLDEAFALFKSHADKQWGLVDCVSFVAMKRAQINDALTVDHHFVQAGFNALLLPPAAI
jgi:uncharacterized protein